jgi:nitrite reductase/ring-hydroxylating ferredoxin subunit
VTSSQVSRRQALAGAAVAGVGASILGACSEDEPKKSTDGSGGESGDAPVDGGAAIATTTDIPEGGGAIFKDQNVVITQPKTGEFKAFDATCLHRQCIFQDVTDTINCGCHGAQFAIADGKNVTGPGGGPPDLGEIAVRKLEVKGKDIFLA